MANQLNPAKTEVVLVSKNVHDYDLRLANDDAFLNIVETHKHLVINLLVNNKWTKHNEGLPVFHSLIFEFRYQLIGRQSISEI